MYTLCHSQICISRDRDSSVHAVSIELIVEELINDPNSVSLRRRRVLSRVRHPLAASTTTHQLFFQFSLPLPATSPPTATVPLGPALGTLTYAVRYAVVGLLHTDHTPTTSATLHRAWPRSPLTVVQPLTVSAPTHPTTATSLVLGSLPDTIHCRLGQALHVHGMHSPGRVTLERVVRHKAAALWLPWRVRRQVVVVYEHLGQGSAALPFAGWLHRACPTVTGDGYSKPSTGCVLLVMGSSTRCRLSCTHEYWVALPTRNCDQAYNIATTTFWPHHSEIH